MCVIRRTNITFDIDNPDELEVYNAVQQQPHKQRSKYLLMLAYKGLMNSSDNNIAISEMQRDIAKLISMVSNGIRIDSSEASINKGTVSEPDEMEIFDIDTDALGDMLGLIF